MQVDDLEIRVNIKQEELSNLAANISAAHEVIGESEQKLAEAAEARKWYDEQRNEITKIEGERKQQELLRASIAGLKIENTSLEEALTRTKHEQAAESAKITNLAAQRANLSADVQTAKEQLDELTSRIQEKTLQIGITTNEFNLKRPT